MTVSGAGLKGQLQADMKSALKAGDRKKLGVVRLMLAAIKQQEIDGRSELGDHGVIAVLDKMVKQRRDSAGQFRAAGRIDLADVEEYEIGVIQEYLPEPFTSEEVLRMVTAAVEECGADSVKELGKVMALLKPMMQGRADLGAVSREVKNLLSTR
ncbi:MAG: GatB/YqeY domain-containing protein [Methylococcaceae bacterium]|nr:GatB/YqeY domain-containing protein [Methylococcaceae bacterium]MCI0667434.1 GatB/YqeY domain-containing protein [Methylococcaceae bacterium]MCI0734478.1 GatB/YqeY domain-containing protein [Methylococcaceae bacterium]